MIYCVIKFFFSSLFEIFICFFVVVILLTHTTTSAKEAKVIIREKIRKTKTKNTIFVLHQYVKSIILYLLENLREKNFFVLFLCFISNYFIIYLFIYLYINKKETNVKKFIQKTNRNKPKNKIKIKKKSYKNIETRGFSLFLLIILFH